MQVLLGWVPSKDAEFSVAKACQHAARCGHSPWNAGALLRTSPLFHATGSNPSLPEEFRATTFRLSAMGRIEWERLQRQLRRDARAARVSAPSKSVAGRTKARAATSEKPAPATPGEATGALDEHAETPHIEKGSPKGASSSLAGFWRSPGNVKLLRQVLEELGGDGWVDTATLYPALREAYEWPETITNRMITSALGMLASLGDIERVKGERGWKYRVGKATRV